MPTVEVVESQGENLSMGRNSRSIEPRFPEDLERLILENAFDPDDFASNLNMMLVAQRTRDWIKPLLCKIIFQSNGSARLTGARQTLDFPNFNKHWSTCNLADIGPFVKHVLLAGSNASYTADPKYSDTKEFIFDLLDHCSKIENLACWREAGISEEVISLISGRLPAIRRFSSSVPPIPREVWLGPGFRTLTHLDLLDCPGNWFFDVLASYGNLTHLCVFEPADWTAASIQLVLDSSSTLKVFIIGVATGSHRIVAFGHQSIYPEMVQKSGDNRIVLLDSEVLHPEDWLEGAKGRFNAWSFAEWIIEARKYKYFKAEADDWSCAILDMDFEWERHLTPEGMQWYSSLRRQVGSQRLCRNIRANV